MNKLLATLFIALTLTPNFAEAARLWSSGAELNDITTAGKEFFLTSGVGCTVESTGQRSGAYVTKCTTTSALRQGFIHHFAATTQTGPYFARFYLYVDTLPNANNGIFFFSEGTAISSGARLGLYMNSSGQLILLEDAAVAVGSPSAALNTGQWYRIEVYVDNSGGDGAEVARAYIDGVEFAGASNLTIGANYQAFKWGTNLLNSGSTNTGTFFYDDVALSNTALPGEGNIVHCRPNASGDNAATAGTFADIDEVTPDDATTKIELDTDGGMTADYNIDSASTCGIDSYDTINLVAVGIREAAETAAAESWKLRIKSQASGTAFEGSTLTHNDTTYRTNGDQIPQYNYSLTSDTDPQSGGVWTPSLLDSAQIGIETTDGNPDVHVSTLWALVEYQDGDPPAAGETATYQQVIWFE